MKSKILVIIAMVALVAAFTACAGADSNAKKIGMVTDAGTIDDKSFNQGTWEGIVRAETELGIEKKYLKPSGTTTADYVREIANLYDAGYRFIVTPGFKFENAIFEAQSRFPEARFVLLDGVPHAGDYNVVMGANTVSISFAEHQSGFLAGVATALQLQSGAVGFVGGMEIPPVQRFNWGFQQGVVYANANLGTSVTMDAQNFIYQGTFHDVAAGQQLAITMFDRGVKAIFAAAGGVGVGVINEAKARASQGQEVWVVGVDVDQYNDGIFSGTRSVILTSAMKRVDSAAFEMIRAHLENRFPGGQFMTMDASNAGIGIPAQNPNLRPDVQAKVLEILAKLKAGTLTVSPEQGSLIK
jgi:basic membrane protein A